MSWSDFSASPEFQNLSPEARNQARLQYFQQRIAPKVPEERRDSYLQSFLRDTQQDVAPQLAYQRRPAGLPVDGEDQPGFIGDSARSIGAGLVGIAEGAARGVEHIAGTGNTVSDFIGKGTDALREGRSDATKEAVDNFSIAGDGEFSVRGLTQLAMEGAGSMAGFLVPGGILAGGARVGLGLAGATPKVAQVAGSMAGFGTVGGLVGGSGTMEEVTNEVLQADFNDLAQAPGFKEEYRRAYEANPEGDHAELLEQAREQLSLRMGDEAFTGGAVRAAVIEGLLGPVYDKIIRGTGGVVKSIARGSATEAAQEASDAAVGTAQVNNALTDIDGRAVSQDVLSNAIDSGAVAAISGGAVGGATGGANRLMRNEDESIDPEVAQMLDEALTRVNAGEGTPQDQQLLLEHDGTIYSGYGDPEAQANARATTEQAMTGQFGQARNTGLEGEVIPGQPMQPPAAAPGVIEGEGDEQGRLAGANDLGLPQPDGVVYGQEPDWMVQQRQDSADRLARAREVTASALTDQFTPSPMAEAVAQPEQSPRMLGLPDMGMTPAPDSMMMPDVEGRTTDPVLGDGRDGFTSQSSTQPGMNVPVPKQSTAQLLSDLADAVARVDQMRAEGIRPKVVGERGSQSRVKLGENYEDVDFMLVDLAKNPAMRPDFNVGENQNRDRTRAAYTQQVSRIAQGLDFNELGNSARMSEGAPTVTPEGVIIGGNGRIAAILEAYKKGTADNYRQELESRAEEFGIKPNKINDMQQPALVRRFVNPVDVAMATQRSNEQTGADMSALEQARIDGDRLADIPDLNVDAGGNFNTPANADFIRQFVRTLPTNEQNAVATRDGKLSQSGVTRLRNALLYKAYGDTDVLAELVEASDTGRRNILAALTEAAPKVAQVRAAIDRGELHDADISAEIVEAVGLINDLTGRDLAMPEYLAQGDMMGGITDLAKDIAQVMDSRKRSAKGIRDFIVAYYDGVIALGSPDQQGLFGNATISVPDLIGRAADSIGVSIDGQASQENQARQPEVEDGADGADQERPDPEGSGTDEGFSLSTQTEEDLAQQEAERAAAADAEAKATREAEQKAAADREADDFVLSGSNRTADVATARGQNDLFGAVTTAANEAATSPTNDLPDPTDAQKEAGNYKKGKVRIQGLDISIENPKGSTRSGTDPDGNEWSSTMAHHYGDIKGTTAADGDNLDVFIGPDLESNLVFVIDQVNADGSFDEHKILIGFRNQKAARDGYRANYDTGWKVGPTTRMTMEQFKEWLKGDTTKPVSDKVKAAPAQAEPEQESGPSEPEAQADSGQNEPTEQPEPAAFDLNKPAHEVATDLRRAMSGGEAVPVDQVKAVFERIVADPEATKADLNKLKKADLVKYQTGFARSDAKKADMVEMAYDGLISRFRFIGNNSSFISTSMGEDRVKLARDHLNTLDDAAVAQYARDQKAATDERIAEIKAFRESLDNPQTLEDFREVVRIKGADSLSDEQRARYDTLIAEAEQATKPSIREGLQSEDEVELGEPVEGVHGKTGETIFNVKVITRLGKDKFKEAAGFARTLKGGYYRGNFYFKSIEDAELFSAWVNGRDVDTTEQVQARTEQRQANAKDRLKDMADRIEARAQESLNADRKENTAKRIREADGARKDAENDLRRANLLRAIADSDAKFIKGATQKVQIDLLDRMVRQLRRDAPAELTRTTADGDREWLPGVANETKVKTATMPLTDMYASTANDLAGKMQDIKGMKLASRRLLNGTKGIEGNKKISVQGDTLTKLIEYAESHADKYDYIKDLAADYKRLQRMSITSRPTLRAALLEFMEISQNVDSGVPTQSRLQTLERDLQRTMVGNRNAFNEFFPTPEATAREVVDMAGIEPGMRVLEPSAGNGALADIAKEAGADVDVVEMGGDLRDILEEKGHNLVAMDFLEYQPDQQYDRIVMNPPFSKDQDIQHVSHAYRMLKPGGRMVAITSSPAGDRQNSKNKQFREFLDAVGAEEQALPEGAFKSSMNPTGANTKAIVIDKPEADAPDAPMFSRGPQSKSREDVNQWTAEVADRLGLETFLVYLNERTNTLNLSMIEVKDKKQGLGSQAMQELVEFADANGYRVALSPGLQDDRHGTTSRSRLVRFYKRFGFVENKGRKKDFEISEGMYREPKFSRGQKPKGMQAADIQAAVDAMPSRIKAMVNVVQSISDLPAQYQKLVDPTVRGLYAPKTGKVYIVADGLGSLKEAEGVIVHEVVGHAGLRGLMAKQLHPLLNTLYRNGQITDAMLKPILARYKLDMADPKQRIEALEEYIAHAAQFAEAPPFMDRVRAAVRRALRNMGFASDWTDADIAALIANHKSATVDAVLDASRMALNRVSGTNADGSLRFSRTGSSQPAPGNMTADGSADTAMGQSSAVTDTPAFKRWFGDSKVVDGNGDPLVVYHGTQDAFNEFRIPENAEDYAEGIFFTGDEGIADLYSVGAQDLNLKAVEEVVSLMTDSEAETAFNKMRQTLGLRELLDQGYDDTESYKDAINGAAGYYFDDYREESTTGEFEFITSALGIDSIYEVNPASKTVPVYLNLRNPLIKDMEGDEFDQEGQARLIKQAKDQGNDGLILKNYIDGGSGMPGFNYESWGEHDVYVAFEPEQVKSATENQGTFDPANPDIRMSRAQPGGNFAAPDETLAKVAIRKIADKFKVLKDVQANIRKAGGVIDEDADAYRYEELFHGKAEDDLRRMREGFVEPLAKKMARYGIEQSELDEYLYARHARERNEHIASINPDMPDGGSGMTNAEADAILAKVAATGKQGEYDQIAGIVYDILATRRDIIRQHGLEGDDMIDAWEAKYQHYVPLKGFAENEQDDARPRSGKGFTIAGKESKRAMGRGSQAASPSSYAVNDLTETIIRRRKNEVGQAFLRLVEANPNKKYWEVFSDDKPEMDRRIVKRRDPETGEQIEVVEERPIPMAMMADRYFQTKRNGKTFYIKMEDQRLMEAMKNIGPDTSNFVIQTLASINRVLSALNTSYNPEFVVGNFARDVQTAVLNLTAEQSRDDGKAQGERIAKNTVKDIPKAMKAIYRSLRGKSQNGEWMRWFDEFRAEGAKTGYFDMKDIDGQAADIERLITIAKGGVKGNALKWAQASSQLVEDLNNTVENAVRLAAYVNARKAGISAPQAASLAKNMTVNFNRRGQMGTTLNALYMFANASIQGSMNFARTMGGLKGEKGDPIWSRLNTAQKIAVGMMGGAYAFAMANRLAAGDDEDGENWYDKVPDYVKERNLVLMKSLFGGEQDGSYWTIPLPYGYNIFHSVGSNIEAMVGGDRSVGAAATDLTLAALGSFSPIGFNDSQSGVGLILKNVTPTLGKPFVDVAMNENFFGSSIYNENMPFGTPEPDSSLSRRSTPMAYKAIAGFLNDVSGGSQWRSGAIDVNPDVMRYFVDYYLGAAGNFTLNKLPDNAFNLANGIDMQPNQVLFLSRVRGQVQPYADRDRFYERRDEINQIMEEVKGRTGRERLDFLNANRPKLALRGLIDATEDRLKRLRKQRDRIYALDLSPAELDERLEVIEIKQKQAIDRFNKAYRRATSDQ